MDQIISQLDYTHPHFQTQYGDALNWIHQNISQEKLKAELVSFSRTIDLHENAESIPDSRINTEGSIAYCLNRGAKLDTHSIERVKRFILQFKDGNDTVSDNENIDEQSAKIRAHFGLLNCRTLLSQAMHQCVNGSFNIRELPSFVRETVQKYGLGKTRITRELYGDFKEFLQDARRDEVCTAWVKPLGVITDTLHLMVANRKQMKGKKGKNKLEFFDRKGEKAAAKINIKEEDNSLGLKSINPTHVVGADVAVVFNTKNRHCEVYKAKEGSKLSINGARIINFDESTSGGKTIRKPEEALPRWTSPTSVRRLEVLLEEINGKSWPLTGKINKNYVIIKVL